MNKEFSDIDFIDIPAPKVAPKASKTIKAVTNIQNVKQVKEEAKSIHNDKRMARRKTTAEDFTPKFLVNEMLDKLPKEVWEANKTFCDPACGNGNFLIEVFKRKLEHFHSPIDALKSIYGCDIMNDNINECRLRLMKVINEYVKLNKKIKQNINPLEIIKIVKQNIKWTPLKNFANGSLDYDFEFKDTMIDEEAQKTLDKIRKQKLLDQVSI
jgi:type I restriction-modification system DNA methylase subunit